MEAPSSILHRVKVGNIEMIWNHIDMIDSGVYAYLSTVFFVVLFYQHIKQCFVKLNFKMSVLIYHCSKAVLSLKLT